MTAPTVVQSASSEIHVAGSSLAASFGVAPTNGNLLVAILASGTNRSPVLAGWTKEVVEISTSPTVQTVWWKVAGAGESPTVTVTISGTVATTSLVIMEVANGAWQRYATTNVRTPIASVTPDTGVDCLLIASVISYQGYGITAAPTSYTLVADQISNTGSNSTRLGVWRRAQTSPSGAYAPTGPTYAGGVSASNVHIVLSAGAPTADFSATPTSGTPPLSVVFTDLSTGTVTSWAWDFGDGNTSTSQNPTHVYSAVGTYTVTLTVTNAIGSDSETKTAFVGVAADVGYVEPVPAGVLLEIYASAPGAAKWDVAKWDEDEWSSAGWRDVTPYGVQVDIEWGSTRPELGILSVPNAASWAVDYYDPDRVLDPSNVDGPYYGDLIPFLPIRVSHRGTVVRQGHATGISHNFRPIVVDGPHGGRLVNGYMRCADNITLLANAKVPSDSTLADTLYARAVDAIAAAGLNITVGAPVGTDPPVSPWITGERDWSVWDWIKDAAQEVLYIPIIDRLNVLRFRAWQEPLYRGRSLGSPELIDLGVVTDYSGLYSVVQAREDDTTLVERATTPPPRYGARTYTRDEITIDPGGWADAVLADRTDATLLYLPGDLRPLTALSAESLATMEAVELVIISAPEQTPPVDTLGIVVGGSMTIIGKTDDEAVWRFRYQVSAPGTAVTDATGGTFPLGGLMNNL